MSDTQTPVFVTWARADASQYKAIISLLSLQSTYHETPKFIILWKGEESEATQDQNTKSALDLLRDLGAEIRFHPFAQQKIANDRLTPLEGLRELGSEPFLAMQPDTYFQGPLEPISKFPIFDFLEKPIWPKERLYGPTREEFWVALLDQLDLDPTALSDSHLKPYHPARWAGTDGNWILGPNADRFFETFDDLSQALNKTPPKMLSAENLDEIAPSLLPLLTALRLGYRRDQEPPSHPIKMLRHLALFYASSADHDLEKFENLLSHNKIKRVLKNWDAARRLIYQGKGREIHKRFYSDPPAHPHVLERKIRNQTKFWIH